ncbi:hypothetical protein ACQJBY_018877 [Aegilops geniculata]
MGVATLGSRTHFPYIYRAGLFCYTYQNNILLPLSLYVPIEKKLTEKSVAHFFLKKPIHSLPTAFFTQPAPHAAALPPTPTTPPPHPAGYASHPTAPALGAAPPRWPWAPPHLAGHGRCPPRRPRAPPHLSGHGCRRTPPAPQAAPPRRPRAPPHCASHGRRPTPPAPRAA